MTTRQHKSAAMYGITRGPRGWKVALTRERVILFKQFCYSTFGSEQSALAHAQAWRDEMVKKHPPVAREQRASQLRRNNKTGVPGVSCKMGPDGKPSMWRAQTHLGPGNHLVKSFSVARYGAEAKLLAIAERQKQLQQMAGLFPVHPAETAIRESMPRPLPADCPAPLDRDALVRINNKSGFPGVAYRPSPAGGPGWWIASTYIGGKNLVKSFPIKKYGEEKAKALAIAERQKQLQQKKGRASSRRVARPQASGRRHANPTSGDRGAGNS